MNTQFSKMIFKALVLALVASVVLAEELSLQQQWTKFKADHNKSYSSPDEEQRRLQIFEDNLKLVQEHNKKYEAGQESYTLGINQFSDLTNEEFRKTHLGFIPRP